MGYSSNPKDYTREELRSVAELMFDKDRNWSDNDISLKLNIQPRQKLISMRRAVMKAGIVHIVIEPSRIAEHSAGLRSLEARIREMFKLRDCQILPGRVEMLQSELPDNVRELIVDDITRAAAYHVQFRFETVVNPCLAVVYGFVTRKIANHLCSNSGIKIVEEGLVVAAHGERTLEMDRFDANSIVHDIARRFGCKFACLPLPFIAPTEAFETSIRKLPLVDQVLGMLESRMNMAVLGLASRHQQEWGKAKSAESGLHYLQNQLSLQQSDIEVIKARGLGTIGGLWFDSQGEDVEYSESFVPGLKLNDLRRIVPNHPVILACGGQSSRLPALAVALKKKLCSVWIGDEASAMALLGDQEVNHKAFGWSEEEQDILDRLHKKEFV